MSNIKVKMKDGTVREFLHEGRPGGSYSKSLSYQPGFVIIENEWGVKIAIPSDMINEITEEPERW